MFSIKSQARIVRSDIPSCSSFNARKMISYIHARISENQSNIEILIHDNSTPFLLRDTRAFLPNLCSERVSQREKEGAIPRRHAITPFQTTMIAILPFTAHRFFSSTIPKREHKIHLIVQSADRDRTSSTVGNSRSSNLNRTLSIGPLLFPIPHFEFRILCPSAEEQGNVKHTYGIVEFECKI